MENLAAEGRGSKLNAGLHLSQILLGSKKYLKTTKTPNSRLRKNAFFLLEGKIKSSKAINYD